MLSTLKLTTVSYIGREEEKKLSLIVTYLMELPQATEFINPVDWEDLQLTDYPLVIKHPMNLLKVQEKLKGRQYRTVEEVLDQVQLIWDNCKVYNSEGPFYVLADKMERSFKKMIKNYLPNIQVVVPKPINSRSRQGVAALAALALAAVGTGGTGGVVGAGGAGGAGVAGGVGVAEGVGVGGLEVVPGGTGVGLGAVAVAGEIQGTAINSQTLLPTQQPPSKSLSKPTVKPMTVPPAPVINQIQEPVPVNEAVENIPEPRQISESQKKRFQQRIKQLNQHQRGLIVIIVLQNCPEGFKQDSEGRCQMLLDNIDVQTFRRMNQRIDDLLQGEKGAISGSKKLKL